MSHDRGRSSWVYFSKFAKNNNIYDLSIQQTNLRVTCTAKNVSFAVQWPPTWKKNTLRNRTRTSWKKLRALFFRLIPASPNILAGCKVSRDAVSISVHVTFHGRSAFFWSNSKYVGSFLFFLSSSGQKPERSPRIWAYKTQAEFHFTNKGT